VAKPSDRRILGLAALWLAAALAALQLFAGGLALTAAVKRWPAWSARWRWCRALLALRWLSLALVVLFCAPTFR
jgi:hypothetical protein